MEFDNDDPLHLQQITDSYRFIDDDTFGETGPDLQHWLPRDTLGYSSEAKYEMQLQDRVIYNTLSEEERKRHETQREAHFDNKTIDEFLESITGDSLPSRFGLAVGGVLKLYCSSLITQADIIREKQSAPNITAEHLYEAHRILEKDSNF